MPIDEPLKYDIRVRDRLLRKGLINEGEIKTHLDALSDLGDRLIEIELKQPALQKESERAEYAPRISRPSPTLARPAPIRPFDEEDESEEDLAVPPVDDDDEDDDLDDEDEDEDEDEKDEKGEASDTEDKAKKEQVDEDDWGTP